MTQKELSLLFSPNCHMDGQILLIPPAEFCRLKGKIIDGSRMFMFVCNGNLDLELNGRQYEMNEYSFFDIMEMTTARVNKSSLDLRAWCLFVTFNFASESLKSLRPGPLNILLEQQNIPIWKFSKKESDLLEGQLLLLKDTLGNMTHYYRQELVELYFRSFSLELGNIMFTYEEDADVSSSCVGKRDFITLNFMKLVFKNFAVEHKIKFYADALCISSKHLTRVIKEMTGKTPYTIISDEIVHQAMNMLEDDKISVGRIAEELRFSDQAAFCKFFKKKMNVSPIVYRNKGNKGRSS
ncbi:MAG: transcriptional regulator, AraC family [Bacteroidetes bacterium]|jgi:AraC family transcriptional regulator, transcriptional activator of pobA|nr:transcriptional regulator, AraC family [Bacteroidota bacterium]